MSASTNALGPEALTSLTYGAAETSRIEATRRAEATAWEGESLDLSTPKRSTRRGFTSATPPAPVMLPRFAVRVVALSRSPSPNDGSTTDGAKFAAQVPSVRFRAASVS